jgi:transcriptional regulator with XRE-family HTH domain
MPQPQPRQIFGRHIQDLRRDKRWTQQKMVDELLARGHSLDVPYLSKIENGRILPTEAIIRTMAELLDADAGELLDLAGRFDPRALQDIAAENPKVGALLRRNQSGKLPRETIERLLADIDAQDDDEGGSTTDAAG